MNLARAIQFEQPFVWVETQEPELVLDQLTVLANKPLFHIDGLEGIQVFRNGAWKTVLFEKQTMDGEVFEVPSWDAPMAVQKAIEEGGILYLRNDPSLIESLKPIFYALYSRWRRAYLDDSHNFLAQIIIASPDAEVPPDLLLDTTMVGTDYISAEEIAEVVATIYASDAPIADRTYELTPIVNASKGMREGQLLNVYLNSIRERGALVPEFIEAQRKDAMKANSLLEIRKPTISLDQIGGLDYAKQLINYIVWCWENPQQTKEMGIQPLHRMLLVGVPGCGKSAICEATAQSLNLDLAKFGVSQMLDPFIGRSEQRMREGFKQLNALRPIVCWVDEFGRDMNQGDWQGDGGTTGRVVGEFLTGLQELADDILFMAAANKVADLSPEIMRAERFDKILFVGFPTESERFDIFGVHLADDPNRENFNLAQLAAASKLFTGAEIQSLIRETRFEVSLSERRAMTTEDLLAHISSFKNRMWLRKQEEMIKMYKIALNEWDWASTEQREEAGLIVNAGGRSHGVTTVGGTSMKRFS